MEKRNFVTKNRSIDEKDSLDGLIYGTYRMFGADASKPCTQDEFAALASERACREDEKSDRRR